MWKDGSVFDGIFKDGMKHGQGHYKWEGDETEYIGEWQEDNINGEGHYKWADGRQYKG